MGRERTWTGFSARTGAAGEELLEDPLDPLEGQGVPVVAHGVLEDNARRRLDADQTGDLSWPFSLSAMNFRQSRP